MKWSEVGSGEEQEYYNCMSVGNRERIKEKKAFKNITLHSLIVS